jgi:hypothetical protein
LLEIASRVPVKSTRARAQPPFEYPDTVVNDCHVLAVISAA